MLHVASTHPEIYFLFLTTDDFCREHLRQPRWLLSNTTRDALNGTCPPNIIHLDDRAVEKHDFIRACDAMLHARREGETFGLAIAEFAVHNKPVITSNQSFPRWGALSAHTHVDILGSRGLYWYDAASLRAQLLSFDRARAQLGDWNAYRAFEPAAVMRRFAEVFLD